MKTRILHTKFWKDEFIMSLDTKGKCLFNYLLTNENNNLIGIYEIPEPYIALETGLTIPEIQEYKIKFQQAGKFVFYKSWVRIVNAERYNSYSGKKNEKAKERELSYVPEELMTIDTSIDTSIDSLLNHKSKIKNQKSKIKNKKSKIKEDRVSIGYREEGEVLTQEDLDLKEVVEFYNQIFQKNISSTKGFESNFKQWRKIHNLKKMKQAITNARLDKFWADKLTLTILFRQKNPRGENVDLIEDLSNRTIRQDKAVGLNTKIAFT